MRPIIGCDDPIIGYARYELTSLKAMADENNPRTTTVTSMDTELSTELLAMFTRAGFGEDERVVEGADVRIEFDVTRALEVREARVDFIDEDEMTVIPVELALACCEYDLGLQSADVVKILNKSRVNAAAVTLTEINSAVEPPAAAAAAPAVEPPLEPAASAAPKKSPSARRSRAPSAEAAGGKSLLQQSADRAREKALGELLVLLEDAHLAGLADDLVKAGIVSVAVLEAHTVAEIEASLARPTVKGTKFVLSAFQRRMLASLGLQLEDLGLPGATAVPSAPTPAPRAAPSIAPSAAAAMAGAGAQGFAGTDLAALSQHLGGSDDGDKAAAPAAVPSAAVPAATAKPGAGSAAKKSELLSKTIFASELLGLVPSHEIGKESCADDAQKMAKRLSKLHAVQPRVCGSHGDGDRLDVLRGPRAAGAVCRRGADADGGGDAARQSQRLR